MNRKHFLSFLITAGTAAFNSEAFAGSKNEAGRHSSRIPPYLMEGDTIGITSPASFISMAEIQPAVAQLQHWGFKVEIGKTIGSRDFTRGGTDGERAADLQQMLDRQEIKAILCARGGYGLVRIIDQLNFRHFKKHPKWLIGFSDITLLHTHINSKYKIASIHSKMCNSFPNVWEEALPIQIETILSIRQVLTGQAVRYTAAYNEHNREGRAEGILVGGNLSLIETATGSSSELHTANKILFIEDTNEPLYSLDRMLWNLKRSGKLDKLKGLIIGGFKLKPEEPGEEFGISLHEIVLEKVKEYDYPVCFDFPVGHQINNFALKCGAAHILNIDQNGSTLTSI
ncbi:S66 peptidase family protein [Pedobacter psychroterrae]|uniref:LD-carboxypeptidase n=1 Tax=Pedobacter psychroterrae TaxID=2530453 RepID=A0A4V2MKZ8_9SPHI|nr:LD-carboxypeptidase [Pedobacter psychroterrae]TCD00147.1 LD-carboxypeptidase [Pedobacter psychroterrae]